MHTLIGQEACLHESTVEPRFNEPLYGWFSVSRHSK